MINVQQISSYLARLQPDSAVQKYAALHKDDPYIMALALSEANRRKAAKTAQHINPPEQPKVVDQAIASMAAPMPEDVGIAQLPTGPMEYAAGGIVAFDEGGEVPRFNGETGSYLFPEGSLLGRFQRGTLPQGGYLGAVQEGGFLDTTAEARRLQALQLEAERRRNEERNAAFNRAAAIQDAAGASTVIPISATPAAAAAKPETGAARTGPGGAGRTQAAGAPGTAPAGAGITGLDVEGMTRRALAEADKAESPIAGQLRELSAERVKAKEAEAAGLEDIQKRFDNIFAGRKQRLESRESEIAEMRNQNIGIAALAGAAELLEGRRGREGEAFGKALRTGTAQYGAGLDKIRSAQEKIFDARDRLEEVEAQRGEMSARELFKARNEVRNTMLSGKEDLIKATMDERKIGREAALKIVDNQIKVGLSQFEQAEATRRARIQAGAQSPNERMALALGGGNLEAGLRKMAEIQAGKFDPKKAYTEYLVAAQKMPGADLLSYSQFIGQFAIPVSPSNNPAAAPGTDRARPPGT